VHGGYRCERRRRIDLGWATINRPPEVQRHSQRAWSAFDIYRFPTIKQARQFGKPTVPVMILFPSGRTLPARYLYPPEVSR
jgi:hypothetical protein